MSVAAVRMRYLGITRNLENLGRSTTAKSDRRESRSHCDAGRLRAGRNGRSLRRYCARSHDLRADDLRDDAGLCGDRPADDCEYGEPFYFFTIAAGTHLRSPGSAGWHTPA